MGPDAVILMFLILSLQPALSLSFFTLIKRLSSSSSLSAIRVVSSAYLQLLIFLPEILIPIWHLSSLAFYMMFSAYKLNKQGDTNFGPVCFSMSSSNCCFLTCIPISQEVGKVVWYSHHFKNFSQFVLIHTVKGFSVINDTDVFWNSFAFFMIEWMLAIWYLVPLPFLNPAFTSRNSQFTHYWSLAWRIWALSC